MQINSGACAKTFAHTEKNNCLQHLMSEFTSAFFEPDCQTALPTGLHKLQGTLSLNTIHPPIHTHTHTHATDYAPAIYMSVHVECLVVCLYNQAGISQIKKGHFTIR